MMRARPSRTSSRSGFTLVELFVAMTILALVLLAFSSGFSVLQDRQSASSARTELRGQASATLEEVARELVDSAPGYVDTVQRGKGWPLTLGSPSETPTDVFEDTLGGDLAHPKRQCLNCSNTGGIAQSCKALSPLGSTQADLGSLKDCPGRWLGLTTASSALTPAGFQGLALTRQMAPGGVCPFCGFALTANLAYTDVLLFLTPRDVDHGGWAPQLSSDASKPVWSAIVVYAPWIDDAGAGSLRRYTLSFASIVAAATANPGNVTLPQLMDPDGDGVLFPVASPQTYDLGDKSTNYFVLAQSPSVPLNPGRPSIWWQKKDNARGEHVILVFDRETGTVFWDIARQLGASWFKSTSPAGGLARTVRTLGSGPGFGCCDFAASNVYSNAPLDPIPSSDQRRVRLATAIGRSFASGIRGTKGSGGYLDSLVALASLDVCVRNSP